jgi:hypothetical protein
MRVGFIARRPGRQVRARRPRIGRCVKPAGRGVLPTPQVPPRHRYQPATPCFVDRRRFETALEDDVRLLGRSGSNVFQFVRVLHKFVRRRPD